MPAARRPIPPDVDQHVREAARNRCGYCLSPQHLVMARLEIEHIIPQAAGGADDESNHWLALTPYTCLCYGAAGAMRCGREWTS